MERQAVEEAVNKTLHPTLDIAWKVWKFRTRLTRSVRDASHETALIGQANQEELNRLVRHQTAYWETRQPLSQRATMDALHDLNAGSTSAFILSVRGHNVRLWKKRRFSFPAAQAKFRLEEQRSFLKRAMLYRGFIETVLRRSPAPYSFDMALDVTDLPQHSVEVPIFSFQKERGTRNLLLPDVDFFHSKWYQKEHDALSYDAKAVSACFVGSSTGDWHTVDSIRNLESRRLRIAAHFHQHPLVRFQIANATQCLSEEAKTVLMSQPYFSSYVSWEEQLRHRFLIVMDGNGATCSRLVKGLMSNSVVVKFDSPHELYYFPALTPGHDLLVVHTENELEHIVEREAAHPGNFRDVSQNGQQFATKYLNMVSVMNYTALLLNSFAMFYRR